VSFFGTISEKPWLPAQGRVDDLHGGPAFEMPMSKLGLRVFFAVVSVIFFLLVISYGARMAFEDWKPAPQTSLLLINTVLLLIASIALQTARSAAARDDLTGLKPGLVAGGLFAIAFLVGQAIAWRQLDVMVGFNITNPAIAFFYLITVLHAMHLVGGLVAWARTTFKVFSGAAAENVRLSIELCSAYWDFLLVVWLVLYGLLFSGNDNLGFILAMCGIT
jgi:cytochrome c oxidase subunit 3